MMGSPPVKYGGRGDHHHESTVHEVVDFKMIDKAYLY
jgi:hypothetical protein